MLSFEINNTITGDKINIKSYDDYLDLIEPLINDDDEDNDWSGEDDTIQIKYVGDDVEKLKTIEEKLAYQLYVCDNLLIYTIEDLGMFLSQIEVWSEDELNIALLMVTDDEEKHYLIDELDPDMSDLTSYPRDWDVIDVVKDLIDEERYDIDFLLQFIDYDKLGSFLKNNGVINVNIRHGKTFITSRDSDNL